MSLNPFTGNSAEPIDPQGVNENNKRSFFIVLFLTAIAVLIYQVKNKITGSISSMNRDFTSAYMMGDPWNGKIVYQDVTSSDPAKQIFSVYDTKSKERKVITEFRIGTDPFYNFYTVGENEFTLHDFVKYSLTYNLATNNKPVLREGAINYSVGNERDKLAMEDTMAVIPNHNANDKPDNIIKIKPLKNYFIYSRDNTELGSGMGIEGSGEQEIDATQLRSLGVYDFNDYGLEFSYWVYDWYSKEEVIDSTSGANLVLVELSKGGNHVTKSFFALIDKKNMSLKLNGYPESTIKGTGYLHDYFINCRRDGKDHILCLTRDKVLRVQISTCKIEEVTTW
jgi:hypothetical protein